MDGVTTEVARTIAAHWDEVVAFASGSVAGGLGSAVGGELWTAARSVVGRRDRTAAPTPEALRADLDALVADNAVSVEQLSDLVRVIVEPRPVEPTQSYKVDTVNVRDHGKVHFGPNYERS
jgi:hypothetical protein